MSAEYERFTNLGDQIDSTSCIIFTVPTGKTWSIRLILLFNPNDDTESVTLKACPDSNQGLDQYGIYSDSIASLGTRLIEYQSPGLMMFEGETLQGEIVENNINVLVFGLEE